MTNNATNSECDDADEAAIQVVPTRAMSPAHAFVAKGCKLGPHLAVSFQQTGPLQPYLALAARRCFKMSATLNNNCYRQ